MYKSFLKRMIDVLLSFFGILFLSLPMLIIALAIKIDSKGPVFFKQKRVGIHKTHFNILKFRTMRTDTPHDAPTHELSDPKKWITKVGGFLRKTSLDELPQLFNVILGDMSLVGPRPPLPSEVRTYSLEERKRLNITPGITCIWQVSGRSELPFSKQIALDKEYIASRSAWKDFLILLKTVPAILTGKGAW